MKAARRSISTLFLVVLLSLLAFTAWRYQEVYDWWRLRDYEAPARIAELADNTRMNDTGRKLFYVHHPELNDREAFNRNCSGFEQTIVLGCYITHQAIYIFDVDDPKLEGIEEVTAAHEMLHAAYDRLSSSEKADVDRMTTAAFDGLNDERLNKVVKSYKERDSSVVPNELHSILATEVRNLPEELENYYRRYFSNRLAVVELSESYEAIFTRQQNRISDLSTQISALESKLRNDKASIESLEAQLAAESQRLNRLRNQGRTEEYNAAVPGFNASVNRYRQLVESYNADVNRLNDMIHEYNSLAIEQKQLINSINSKQEQLQ